jgi:hypothetical protein
VDATHIAGSESPVLTDSTTDGYKDFLAALRA